VENFAVRTDGSILVNAMGEKERSQWIVEIISGLTHLLLGAGLNRCPLSYIFARNQPFRIPPIRAASTFRLYVSFLDANQLGHMSALKREAVARPAR
jgi:hypothetical protein